MTIERILAATDFSIAGDRAVREAVHWARRHSAALRLVHVLPPRRVLSGLVNTDTSTVAVVHRGAAQALRRIADGIGGGTGAANGIELSTGLLTGRASREIVKAARAFDSDLIVVGAHGERGGFGDGPEPLGGTATRLVEHTPVPLLLVRRPASDLPNVVLAALDLQPGGTAVLDWARLAAAGGTLHAVHAYEVPYAERVAAYKLGSAAIDVYAADEQSKREHELAELIGADASHNKVQSLVMRGDAVRTLFERSRALDANLVVLGRRTQHRWRRAGSAYGSVCRYVTSFSAANVLVVPGP